MSKNGKKVIYVNSNIYSQNVEKNNFNKDAISSEIPDPIRYFSGNFWTLLRNNLIKCQVDPLFKVSKIEDNIISLEADKTKFYEDVIENGLLVKKFNKESWKEFITEKIPSETQIFEDYYINFSEPVNISEENTAIEKGVGYLNKEFIFNFYSPEYEALINDQIFDVTLLPTVYDIFSDKSTGTRTAEENLILSLGGYIQSNYVDSLATSNKTNQLLKEYFLEYSKKFTLPELGPVKKQIRDLNSLILLNADKLSVSKKLNNNYVPFPFYMEAKLSNYASEKTNFVHVLSNIGNTLQDLLVYIINQFTIKQKNFVYANNLDKPFEASLQEFDIKNWINSKVNVTSSDRLITTDVAVSYSNLINYLKDNLKIKTRKYDQFMNTSSHYDVIFYKIEKRQFNFNKQNKPINTVIMVPDEGEVIKYIDSQIKYGTEYYYTVSAHTMVIGTEYSYLPYYSDASSAEFERDITNGTYKLKIQTNASYKIFEIPLANFKGSVYETPYTKPIVKIDQQEQDLLISLLDSSTQSTEKFEIIENSDFQIFESIRLSQDNEDPETIVSKINNSANTKIQIYKTTDYPTNYLSLQNKLYKTLSLNNNSKNFTDTIVNNNKYYYAFRYLNEHNIPSNISDIFEIQIINEDGYYYLETNIIDIKKPFPKQISKNMKKYLLIRPSIIQTQPRFEADVNRVEDIYLGPKGQNVWGKPFVLKLTSKKTNRTLKFNFTATFDKKKE